MTDVSGKSRKDPRPDDYSYNFSAPEVTPQRHAEMVRAAKAHAANHLSDPFAFGRIMCHMRRGIANPAEVYADAKGIPY